MTNLLETFETKPCARCGGSGHYSYNQIDGTMCYGCRGRKVVYTKRGAAALAHARELRTVNASEVRAGWLLWVDAPCHSVMGSYKAGWYPVRTITVQERGYGTTVDGVTTWHPSLLLDTEVCGFAFAFDAKVQAVPNRERIAEIRDLALQYQATLNERGKILKRPRIAQLQELSA